MAQPKLKAQLAKKHSKEGLEAAPAAEFTPEQAKIKAKLEQSAVPILQILPTTPAEDPVIPTPLLAHWDSFCVCEKQPNLGRAQEIVDVYPDVSGEMPPGNWRSAALLMQKGRISLSTACISRAGREPGFKKQNQDNCFAFEKYMQEGQALFGAFDGHGPEGGRSNPSRHSPA